MSLAAPTPGRRRVGEAAGWPEKASVSPPQQAALPSLPSSTVHCTWPGTPQERGLQAPARAAASRLSSTFPTPKAVSVRKQAEQGGRRQGLRVGRDSMGPDGGKPVPPWHRRQREMVWTAVSQGFFTAGIVGCTPTCCKVTNLARYPNANAVCLLPGMLPGRCTAGAKSWPGSDSH